MGEYWSVEECRWVTWPRATPRVADADPADEAADVPQPRGGAEPVVPPAVAQR